MKKKLLIAILLLSVLFSGCGDSRNSSPTVVDNADTWEDDSEYEEKDAGYKEDIYEEPEEVVVEKYSFTELTPFSEGRAWVKYDKDGVFYTGIIDKDGNVLYETEGDFYYKSQFQDGLSFYVQENSDESPCGIIDLDGNVLFESQITPDGGYLILGYGNEHFLVKQHLQNYDTNEWRYGAIDKDGNILNEMKTDDSIFGVDKWNVGSQYIGEGFIELNNRELYHIPTSSIASLPFGGGIQGDFYEGYAILHVLDNISREVVINADFRGMREGKELEDTEGVVSVFDGDVECCQEGLALKGSPFSDSREMEYGYYDKDNQLVISLEPYQEKQIRGGNFCGGYAPVVMKGTDGEDYVSVIDKTGNLAYQPVKIDPEDYRTTAASIYKSFESLSASSGYLQITIDERHKIISPDGTIYTPGVDDLSMLEGLTFGDVSEGFILMDQEEDSSETSPYYVSLDTNTIIASAKVASTDTGMDGDESWDDEASGDSSYIIPDSYDITGKWKSVGESGFGQAQPGSIVVFDGNRCNFYSPNDTYAFYKEDDRYVLDITSVLGESLSQTVNIIDDDNIEVAGASLRRIE